MSNINVKKMKLVCNVVSGKVCFVTVFFNIHGRKTRFSASSQNSISEKPTFGPFEVIFLNVQIFPRVGVVISC